MRPLMLCLILWSCPVIASAQGQPSRPAAGPPHAWLFGTWTGGLFPVLPGELASDCRTQPTAAFAQDTVSHGALLATGMVTRQIETARTTPRGTEFRFVPAADATGLGCGDANALMVLQDGTGVTFPGCSAFPYRLERCPPQ